MMIRTRAVVILALAMLFAGAGGYGLRYLFEGGYIRFNYPDEDRFPIRGLDISHHQGKIDWEALRAEKLHFIYIKATEGGDHKDRRFKTNWEHAARIGLLRGAYHFFTFCKEGKTQAQNFIDTVPVEKIMLPPVIDIEYAGNCKARPAKAALLREVHAFATEVRRVYRRAPVLYVTEEIYADYLQDEVGIYPLWFRDIYFEPNADGMQWLFWQYANRGRVKGINGPVDLNVFNGSETGFKRLLTPAGHDKQGAD